MEKRHVIACLVENRFGALARIAGLFSSRGFNIDSLTVGETEDESISRMTIVVIGDDRIMDQVKKQLDKLVDVIEVMDLSSKRYLNRELALVRVASDTVNRAEILSIGDACGARVLEVRNKAITFEATGSTYAIESFIDVMRPFGIVEMARTGKIALAVDPIYKRNIPI